MQRKNYEFYLTLGIFFSVGGLLLASLFIVSVKTQWKSSDGKNGPKRHDTVRHRQSIIVVYSFVMGCGYFPCIFLSVSFFHSFFFAVSFSGIHIKTSYIEWILLDESIINIKKNINFFFFGFLKTNRDEDKPPSYRIKMEILLGKISSKANDFFFC